MRQLAIFFGLTPFCLSRSLVDCLYTEPVVSGTIQKGADKREVSARDACFVSLSEFRRAFEAEANKRIPGGSRIQKATLVIISDHLKMTKLHVSPVGDASSLLSETVPVSEGKGTVELFGINWDWEVDHPVLGDVQIYGDGNPPYARFQVSARLTVSTKSQIPSTKTISIGGTPDRWFYIARGKGKGQDGSQDLSNQKEPKPKAP